MLRITKDTKYYGIDNIEKIITEMKSPVGFTIDDTLGFYTKNVDEKIVTDIVDNFENACEEITKCTDMNLINDVIIRHTITKPLNPGKRPPIHVYHIGKYMVPERTGEEGNYLIIYIGLGESTCEISARVWDQQYGQSKLTFNSVGDHITQEQKKMNIDEFINLFKTIVDTNKSAGRLTSSEYHNIVDRINNSTGLEPFYDETLIDDLLDDRLKNIPLSGADWIDWSKAVSDPLTKKYWEYNNLASNYGNNDIKIADLFEDLKLYVNEL